MAGPADILGIGTGAFRPEGQRDEGQGRESLRTRRNSGDWNPILDWEDIFPGNRGVTRRDTYELFDAPVGIRLEIEEADKAGPFVRAEPDIEGVGGLHNNLIWHDCDVEDDGDRYHLLYGSFPSGGDPSAVGSSGRGPALRYAVSDDGYEFRKPDLGSNRNAVDGPTYGGFFLDPTASKEERIKAIMHTGGFFDPDTDEQLERSEWERRMAKRDYEGKAYRGPGLESRNWLTAWTSPDGISWRKHDKPVSTMGADGGIAAGYDPENECYFAYIRPSGVGRRAIGLTKTTDFHKWPSSRLILYPDAQDPPDTSFYGAYYFSYPGRRDIHCMMVQMYHQIRDNGDAQLAVSRDGLFWTRPERRPVITVGPVGSGEEGIVWPWGTGLVELPDGWWALPYDGVSWLHNARHTMPHGCGRLSWARWRPHRLCGVACDGPGELSLQTITRARTDLTLNYRCKPGGWIKAELLVSIPSRLNPDVSGTAGFTFDDCDPLSGDRSDATVTWNGNSDISAAGDTVVIRVRMFDAKLFAYRV